MNHADKILLYNKFKNILITEGSSGLKKWFKEKWVDISRKTKSGGHPPCGASAGKKERGSGKRKYPKCVPAAKAAGMSAKQKRSAIIRKRKHGSTSRGKAKFVSTYSKK
jgi:hypothetical protein